jgi:excisionase family DNA binding protein
VSRSHLTVPEFAAQTGRDESTIRRLINAGFLQGEVVGGRYLIPATELDRHPALSGTSRFVRPHPPSMGARDLPRDSHGRWQKRLAKPAEQA